MAVTKAKRTATKTGASKAAKKGAPKNAVERAEKSASPRRSAGTQRAAQAEARKKASKSAAARGGAARASTKSAAASKAVASDAPRSQALGKKAVKKAAPNPRAIKRAAPRRGTPKTGAAQASAKTAARAVKKATPKPGTPKSGTPKSGTPKSGTVNKAAPKSGTPKRVTPKSGAVNQAPKPAATMKRAAATPVAASPGSLKPARSKPVAATKVDAKVSQKPFERKTLELQPHRRNEEPKTLGKAAASKTLAKPRKELTQLELGDWAKAPSKAETNTPARDARQLLVQRKAIKRALAPSGDGKAIVDAYLRDVDHPFKAEMEAVRQIILGVSPKLSERIKWNAPSFYYKEDLGAFNPRSSAFAHLILLFPGGDALPDESPILEGSHKDRREVKFHSMDDVKSKRAELEQIVRDWIDVRDR